MFISLDLIDMLEKFLRKNGFRDSGKFCRGLGRLNSKKRKRIVTVRPVKFPPAVVEDIAAQIRPGKVRIDNKHVDDFFRDLEASLRTIHEEGNVPCDLIFQGGGSLPIPEGFLEEMASLGFRVLFLIQDEDGESRLHSGLGDNASITLGEYLKDLFEEGCFTGYDEF